MSTMLIDKIREINNIAILEEYALSLLKKSDLKKKVNNWIGKGNEKWPDYIKKRGVVYPISRTLEQNTTIALCENFSKNTSEEQYVGNNQSDLTLIIKIPDNIYKKLHGVNISHYFILHIDIKTVLNTDEDSKYERLHVGINQCSLRLPESIKKSKSDDRYFIKGSLPTIEDNMYTITSIIKYSWSWNNNEKFIVEYIGIYIIPNGKYFHLINIQNKDKDNLLNDMMRPKQYTDPIENNIIYSKEIRININHLPNSHHCSIITTLPKIIQPELTQSEE